MREGESTEFALRQEDADYEHHIYRMERELLEVIKRGDVEQVIQNRRDNVFPRYSRFIDFSREKTEEYVSVLAVSIGARAAIEAGVVSEESFQLSALYLREVAAVSGGLREYERIRWEALIAFARLVRERVGSSDAGVYVEESKRFVSTNVFKKITVGDVAAALNLSPAYLERIFKQTEGITLGEYIQREKIERAKDLLRYSDRGLLEITEYLGFSSQSYFGKVFKRETGMTPRQYRQENRLSKY